MYQFYVDRFRPRYDLQSEGIPVLPRRWVVERTCAWLTTNRRLNNGDEDLPVTPEALIDIAMSRWMLKRLTQ